MTVPITIETRLGRSIDLDVLPDVAPRIAALYREKFESRFPLNELRRESTAAYNCYGLVFACRRAFVTQEGLKVALEDDGYRDLQSQEEPRVGDLVVYKDESGDISHVGIVVELRSVGGAAKVPRVLSKWGDGPEYLHMVGMSLYGDNWKYMTERQ